MKIPVFNDQVLQSIDAAAFEANVPSPWASFDGLLTEDMFAELNATYPALDLFEKHTGMARFHSQRPHDRWYLALEHSIYDNKKPGAAGCVALEQLHPSWQHFIATLRESEAYNEMIADTLCTRQFHLRFAWHVAGHGCDVSPHLDDPLKAGTHIFYFNTSENWKEEWGGQTLFLGNPRTERMNPEIEDFAEQFAAPIVDNKSMLFRNTRAAWHGVADIKCEEGRQRRLFNAIFQLPERPGKKPNIVKRLANRTKKMLLRG